MINSGILLVAAVGFLIWLVAYTSSDFIGRLIGRKFKSRRAFSWTIFFVFFGFLILMSIITRSC
jgi:hypothetical protein